MAIEQEITLPADPARIFAILTQTDPFAAATSAPAEIDAVPGGAFSGFGGQIEGRFIDIESDRRIVMAWRVDAWDPGVFSLVRFDLGPSDGGTALALTQSGHPAEMESHLEGGWHKMYWDPIAKYVA